MIAYKWVIEKEGKYYPLINFKIDNYPIIHQVEDYKLYKIYNNPEDLAPKQINLPRKNNKLESFGYHFWKNPPKETLIKWNKFLIKRNQPPINGILKCKLLKIKGIQKNYQGATRIVAEEFIPIRFKKLEIK